MNTKIEIKNIDGKVLFAHECKDNTIKKTVEEAVKKDVLLCDADLCGADLYAAYLREARLFTANLHGANLNDTNFYKANLLNAKNINLPLVCPSEGAFICWKNVNNCLVKLLISEDAKRGSATTNKCRCDKAKVLEIVNLKTNEQLNNIIRYNFARCKYTVGEMVYPNKFDDNRWNECSNGIHFFINKCDTINYGKLF